MRRPIVALVILGAAALVVMAYAISKHAATSSKEEVRTQLSIVQYQYQWDQRNKSYQGCFRGVADRQLAIQRDRDLREFELRAAKAREQSGTPDDKAAAKDYNTFADQANARIQEMKSRIPPAFTCEKAWPTPTRPSDVPDDKAAEIEHTGRIISSQIRKDASA
jgi:hypothetical protein